MKPHREIFEFVLAQAETQPVKKKIQLYRALADFAGDRRRADELIMIADQLEAADRQCQEFQFHYTQGT